MFGGTLGEVWDGSLDHLVGPGRVGDPRGGSGRVGGPLGRSEWVGDPWGSPVRFVGPSGKSGTKRWTLGEVLDG